jgi:hypothetical protein
MTIEPTPCPDAGMLDCILAGTAPPENGEELAQHVENCPLCQARMSSLSGKSQDLPRTPERSKPNLNRPWKGFLVFAALIVWSGWIFSQLLNWLNNR